MNRRVGRQLIIIVGQVAVSHLEHLVHELSDVFVASVTHADQQVGAVDAQHEQLLRVGIFLFVKLGDGLQHLSEAVVDHAVRLVDEVVVPDENLVV